MSNHVHVVLTVQPDQANQWSADDEVVERRLRLFPSRKEKRMKERRAAMLADVARIAECRRDGVCGSHPIRAEIAKNIAKSKHTGVRARHKAIRKDRTMAEQTLKPLAGYLAPSFPKISESEYIALVDWTGRQWHPNKRGKISRSEPSALRRLGLDPTHWTHKVKGVGSAYWRVIVPLRKCLRRPSS